MLSGGERQLKQLTGSVNELAGRNVGGAADFGAADILSLRLHQKQLRGAAG